MPDKPKTPVSNLRIPAEIKRKAQERSDVEVPLRERVRQMTHETLTAEPGDVIEWERDGQRFGGTVWVPPSQPDNMLAGDTFIRLNGEWIGTNEHVVSIVRKNSSKK